MHTAWYKIITRTLWSRLTKCRCLDLDKSFICHEGTNQCCHLTTHHDILLQVRTTKIQITVFQTKIFLRLAVLLDWEWWCICLCKDTDILRDDFDVTGCKVLIDCAATLCNLTGDCNDKLGTKLLCLCEALRTTVCFLEDHLQNTASITQIDEDDSTFVPALLHPSHHGDGIPNHRIIYFCTSVTSVKSLH